MVARSDPRFHPLVWPLWLLGGVLVVGSNPLHNLLLLLGSALVALTCRNEGPVGSAFGFFVRIGLVVIAVRITLSLIAVGGFSFGATTIGRLPVLGLPWWLGGLALGGPFTLEMLLLGLTGGVQLLTLLALFGAFNAVADHYGLLRRVPNFLGGAGLAITIGLAFVPQTLAQLVSIREAQRIRGHRFRSWRDTLPLLVPLVSGGIERSLQLAEAMDSRGYGARRNGSSRGALGEQLATVAGLLLVAVGLFNLFYQPEPWLGLALLAVAVVLLGFVARSLGSATPRSRYLRERWQAWDIVVVVASLLLIAGRILVRRQAPETLLYLPLPRATPPAFGVVSIVMLALLLVPAAIVTVAANQKDHRRVPDTR